MYLIEGEGWLAKLKPSRIQEASLRAFALRRGSAAAGWAKTGGAERDRTADLLIANEALSQLSYSPKPRLGAPP